MVDYVAYFSRKDSPPHARSASQIANKEKILAANDVEFFRRFYKLYSAIRTLAVPRETASRVAKGLAKRPLRPDEAARLLRTASLRVASRRAASQNVTTKETDMTVTDATARRTADGRACCVGAHLCDVCRAYHAAAPPNAYAAGITALRVAAGTAEHHARIAAQGEAIRRDADAITAGNDHAFRSLADRDRDGGSCATPDPYEHGLAQRRAKSHV